MSHAHHHAHGHHASRGPVAAPGAAWSLLRASLGQRLAGVAVLLAVLWGLVAWALQS